MNGKEYNPRRIKDGDIMLNALKDKKRWVYCPFCHKYHIFNEIIYDYEGNVVGCNHQGSIK